MTRIVNQSGTTVSRAALLALMEDVTPSHHRLYRYTGRNMYKLKDHEGVSTPDTRRSIAFRTGSQYTQAFVDAMYSDVTDQGPQAPLDFYVVGEDVGVLGDPTFTATSGLNSFSGPEVFTLNNRETGETADVTCQRVYRNRRWTTPIQPNPALTDTYLFENCEFAIPGEAIMVDVLEQFAKTPFSQMTPSVIFKNCTWVGSSSSSRGITGGYIWMENCYIHGTEDAWGGLWHSYAYKSQFVPTTDGLGDPHQDGLQMSGSENFTALQCVISAGEDPEANSAVRLGTDFSAISNVRLLACLLDRGGYTLQLHGGVNDLGISDLTVRACRWTGGPPKGLAGFGAVDSVQVDPETLIWEDNAYVDGTPIPSPV